MKIGFDAKRAFSNMTGLGNYSRMLVETLARYFPENEYFLFSPKNTDNPRLNSLRATPSVKMRFPSSLMKIIHPLWRSFFIKNDVAELNLDIFHGLSHELPWFSPKNVKTVVTIHDLIHERYPEFYPFIDRKIYTWKFKNACRKADVVVAISEQTKRDIIEFYKIEPSKIQVIYQSCHPQFYQNTEGSESNIFITEKYKLPQKYLLYVGTINERKNLLTLVKSLQLIDNQLDVKLVVIGEGGQYFQKVKQYVRENNLESRVIFLKNVDFKDFPAIYQSAQMLVLPSFFEGFGIPIIEALWSGTPVITSKGSCFKEAGGSDSIYVNPNSPEDLAAAIIRVWQDSALRKQMILRGLDYVQRFHEKKIGEQWMKLYQSLHFK